MNYDRAKVDDVVLALLSLNFFDHHGVTRAWITFDWDAMDRLYESGFIADPKSEAKSVVVTREGQERAERLFEKHFSI